MTVEELQQHATDLMDQLRLELRSTGTIAPAFVAYLPDHRVESFALPDDTSRLIMNSGEGKELLFSWMRKHTKDRNVQAWVFGMDAWYSKLTEEGAKHSSEEQQRFVDQGFRKLEEIGWAKVFEALQITAQSAEDVISIHQLYVRDPDDQRSIRLAGPPETHVIKQADYRGRTKMWGATTEDVIGYIRR